MLNGLLCLDSKLDRELVEDIGRGYNRGGSISGLAPHGRKGGDEAYERLDFEEGE
jgi:hypothetical protein